MKTDGKSSQAPIVRAVAPTTQARGAAAEQRAADELARRGATLLARNVRCRGGELDLVALDRGVVVFIEVRLRSHVAFGGAAASITATKRRRIVLAARWWLTGAGNRWASHPCRFDVALLARLDAPAIEWIRGAFDADGS